MEKLIPRDQDNKYTTLYFEYLFYFFCIHRVYVSMIPAMSVFTIVHRALPPLSLPWKRRTSLKGKSPELEIHISEKGSILSDSSISPHAQNNETIFMHRDVLGPVQVAVKTHAHQTTSTSQSTSSAPENIPGRVSDSTSESRTRPTRAQLARAVSWASIIRSRDRWTAEQERELVHAQRQLGRCQKAWSSEQEVWLSYVCGDCFFLFSCCFVCITVVLFHQSSLLSQFQVDPERK